MSLNTLKKMFVFSSEPIKKLLEAIAADQAAVENRSVSATLEKHLIDSMLPNEKNARWFVECSLYGPRDGNRIGNTLQQIFAFNAAGTRGAWSSRFGNLLPIVEFARAESCLCNTIPTGEERELHHFRSQLDSICQCLEGLAAEAEENSRKYYYHKEAKFARDLLKEATDEPQYMRYSNIYQLLIENWEDFKDWSIPFRLLSDMASMEKGWRDTEETRVRLLTLLKEVSAAWQEE